MPKNLKRRYGTGDLHFITFSCYRRLPFLKTAHSRDVFLVVLAEVRTRYQFAVVGYVVRNSYVGTFESTSVASFGDERGPL